MIDRSWFSTELLQHPEAQSEAVLERIFLARRRVFNVLDRDLVAHQKTLEKKISDQGPKHMRVDPHLLGLALWDAGRLGRLDNHTHGATNTKSWFALKSLPEADRVKRLDKLAPLYRAVSAGNFPNLTGDALEVVTFKCLEQIARESPRFSYLGCFRLDLPKKDDRFQKTQPPKTIGSNTTQKEADFIQFGYNEGSLCIECKNYREWLYPNSELIKDLIIKAFELGSIPVLIQRRIHYTTLTNLFIPAGIIAHESYYQYYPSDQEELASQVREKRSLGFTDVLATEEPDKRTVKFFSEDLPKIVAPMAAKWNAHKKVLYRYAQGEIILPQLYTAIGSPAGGKVPYP